MKVGENIANGMTAGDGKMRMRFIFTFFILFICTTLIFARSVTLKWNPVDDEIMEYRIYWGIASGEYDYSRDVGDRTEYKLENLEDGVRYYFSVTAIDFWGNESDFSNEVFTSGEIKLPDAYQLTLNYPNPFNSGTSLNFNLPERNDIEIAIFNAVGQKIAILEQGEYAAGFYRTHWDGTDLNNRAVSSGTYFCVLQAGPIRLTRAITLLR